MREQPAPRASDSCSLPTKLANIHPVLFFFLSGAKLWNREKHLTSGTNCPGPGSLTRGRDARSWVDGQCADRVPQASCAVTRQDPLAIWHFQLCFSVSPRKSRASWWLCGWVGTASLPSSSTWSPGSLTWRGPQSVCVCRSSQTPERGQSQLVSPTSWKFTRVRLGRRVERHLFCPP